MKINKNKKPNCISLLEIKLSSINLITLKLVAALDQCKLSVRISVYVIQAESETSRHDVGSLVINICDALRNKRTKILKISFRNYFPNYLTVHWGRKFLQTLNSESRVVTIRLLTVIISI